MNRIQQWAAPASEAPPQDYDLESALLENGPRTGIPHALFAPMHYEPGYAYPLLVWLHGPEANENELQKVMPAISMRNYVGVAPRGCPAELASGFCWPQSEVSIARAERQIFECIDIAVERYNINTQRVFLGGFGSGGTMAFRIALQAPTCFAGALSLAGPFPSGRTPLVGYAYSRHVPLFIASGRDAESYPVEQTCDELRLFHAAGMNVTLRQYPCGDEIMPQMLHDMDVWMMERVTGIAQQNEDIRVGPADVN